MRRLTVLLLGLVVGTAVPAAGDPLRQLADALAGQTAWQAVFEQEYVPAGFDQGTSEQGVLLLAPPDRLRFEYAEGGVRIFASDGVVARLVDEEGGACEAVLIDRATWGRLPLAALMDPGATAHFFRVEELPDGFVLTPREFDPEVASIRVKAGRQKLPEIVTITDPQGNINRFGFSRWRPAPAPSLDSFRPALPGQTPCPPERR